MKILFNVKGTVEERKQIYGMFVYDNQDIYLFEECNTYPCYRDDKGFYTTFDKEWNMVATVDLWLNKCNKLGRM